MRLWHRLKRWLSIRKLRSVINCYVRRWSDYGNLLFAVAAYLKKRPEWSRDYDDSALWVMAKMEVEAAIERAASDGLLSREANRRAMREIKIATKRRGYNDNVTKNL